MVSQINFKGQHLTLKKRLYEGLEIFEIEWPDNSLDFLYKEKRKDGMIMWKSMTLLPKKYIKKIGLAIQKAIKYQGMDYLNEGFIMPIERNNLKGYASVNAILYREEDGLDVTGNYFVYLLHPVMGSTHFTLEATGNDERPWEKREGAIWIEEDIINEITGEIEMKQMKNELGV